MFLNWCKDFGNCPHFIETRSCLSSIFYQNNVVCWKTTFYVLLVSILYSKTLGQLVRTTLLLGETIFWGDILLKGRQSPWASTLAEPGRKVFQFLPELPRKILSWVNPFECLIKQPGKSICVRRQDFLFWPISKEELKRFWNCFSESIAQGLSRSCCYHVAWKYCVISTSCPWVSKYVAT